MLCVNQWWSCWFNCFRGLSTWELFIDVQYQLRFKIHAWQHHEQQQFANSLLDDLSSSTHSSVSWLRRRGPPTSSHVFHWNVITLSFTRQLFVIRWLFAITGCHLLALLPVLVDIPSPSSMHCPVLGMVFYLWDITKCGMWLLVCCLRSVIMLLLSPTSNHFWWVPSLQNSQ